MNMSYTKHAMERLAERFPETQKAGVAAVVNAHQAFQGAVRDRTFLNNSRIIVMMLEKYGDFNFDYMVKGDMVFVCSRSTVITVIDRRDSGMRNILGPKNSVRFRKKSAAVA